MSDDLHQITALRPPVATPSDEVRAHARERLRAAIAAEAAPAPSRRHRIPGVLAMVAGVAAAAVVAVGAIALLGHRGPGAGNGPAAHRGAILDRAGGSLATDRSGLAASYADALRAGDTLRTSLSAPLQRTAQRALARAIAAERPADGGAFVAMDPDTGAIDAIGSSPGGHDQLDRAIASAGPTGSTLEPITAIAALESGAWSPDATYDDTGEFCVSPNRCRGNAGHAAFGVLDLVNALRVSSDVFFDDLGALLNPADPATHPDGGTLQQWAHRLGLGKPTGIDLPGEASGLLPSPAWRARDNELESQCEHATGPFAGGQPHPPGGCGIADGTDRPWSVGDELNLAVGQGAVQVTPLQLAVAYAALANGGTVVTPHLGAAITAPDGALVRRIEPPAVRELHLDPTDLDAVRAGLRAAASQPGGTSADVFGNLPEPVYGMAGTAQYAGQQDDAWYAGYVPATATSKPIVVVVTVERGGFGDDAAAPVARQIFSEWFTGKPGPYIAGASKTL